MSRIRVLVVDDSVVVRRLVSNVLGADADIDVVGVAANGRIALAKISQLNPDIVTLDIEMPVLDGLGTLKQLRKTRPTLPVIMFSTLTARGAGATLDALSAGANDYVTKPGKVGDLASAMQQVRSQLVPKVKALCAKVLAHGRHDTVALPTASKQVVPVPRRRKPRKPIIAQPVAVVVIGVSTGGPNALAQMLPQLPGDLPVPVLIVQHMPPLFTQMLAKRLDAASDLTVREGVDGEVLEPGDVWLAPGDYHMVVQRERGRVRLAIHQGPSENSCRPAVDPLFRSVAELYGAGALGVVMTGMGRDGLRGSEYVVDAGGHVVTQDEATSVVWGMPGFVTRANLADRVIPLDQIADTIVSQIRMRGLVAAGAR